MCAEKSEPKPKIGFIGLGNMGSRMVTRLMNAGYPIAVYNRTPEKSEPFGKRGATAAASPRELASGQDIIMCSVSKDSAVRITILGPDGALAGCSRGTILVDLSTVYPGTSRRVFEEAERIGVEMIDAPVSGSTPQAEQGTLTIFVGGNIQTFQKCKPILEHLGREIHYMGPSGAGATMKLVVNTVLGVGMQAMAEAVALGKAAGLDREQLLDVLGKTAVIAPGHKSKLDNARSGKYPVAFPLPLMYKDFGLILRQAAELALPMPATAAAQQIFAAAESQGVAEDFSAIIRFMEDLASPRVNICVPP